MQMTITIILGSSILSSLAVVMAFVLGWANKVFHVEIDPKVERILNALPGSNCGGCGYIGCSEYAEAVAKSEATVTLCAPGGSGCAEQLADIMGVDVSETYPYKAVVHCAATRELKLQVMDYRGEQTCSAANIIAGYQGCTYGCLGLGDCVRSCDYDAIHIINGVAAVDYIKCVGCKACARACPRNIISMVPFKSDRMLVVACSNLDSGMDVKAVCKIGCIGCKACSKKVDLFVMEGNIPTIDYDKYSPTIDFSPALDKCPMESLVMVGKPTSKDLAAVADEELPERIEADFKTTVDDTEWRG